MPRRAGLRSDGVGEIAGGGAAYRSEAELLGVGERDGDDAVLEGERREADGVVLDEQVSRTNALAKALRADERREAYRQIRLEAVWNRQQTLVPPDVRGPGFNRFAGELAAGGVEVVGDLKRCEAIGASREGAVAVAFAALIALQLVRNTGILHLLSLSRRGCVCLGRTLNWREGRKRMQPGMRNCVLRISCSPFPGES